MRSSLFEVLSRSEQERIHQASLEILAEIGIKVEVGRMRRLLADHGCRVDEKTKIVTFPPEVVARLLRQAPGKITGCGADPQRTWVVSPETQIFSGLGTPITIMDLETGELRPTTLADLRDHLILFDHLENITANQMDIWPNDVPMHTIHVESIRQWFRNCTKSHGMGTFGVLATRDMMEMVSLAMGGREAIADKHPFWGIVSIQSPLSTVQLQIEGLMTLAEWNQPAILAPEAMAGTTAPVTLAGLIAQHNAEVVSHIVMSQAVRAAAPVLYGTVSTIAEMRRGSVALGAVETGLISAALTQMAHFYHLPCRSVAAGTESKELDMQCAAERMQTLLLTAMSGANYITCVGTLESTTAGAHELTVIDDELIGMVKRAREGVTVDDDHLGLDAIRAVGPDGHYLTQPHTVRHMRTESFQPSLVDRAKRDSWEEKGRPDMVSRARDKARKILAEHRERDLDPKLLAELDAFVDQVKARTVDEYYAAEWEA